ncbi:hypothetical protein BDZ89DRAFT_1066376 [Hymenopellis radicata]|nr:hypothetical protein BDZ89DRAFT_1066376 [Hymenopellis radicata]
MSPQAFMNMVAQMPALRSRPRESYDLESCVCVFDAWCRNHRVPKVLALYESDVPETEDEDEDEETYATVTSFFVPTRHIDYTGKSQLKDIVNAPFAQETEKDQACLAYLARRLHDDGGGLVVDTTGFTFRWVKDYHPNYSVVSNSWLR